MAVTRRPRVFSNSPEEEAMTPLPMPLITPPDTRTYFIVGRRGFKEGRERRWEMKICAQKFTVAFLTQEKKLQSGSKYLPQNHVKLDFFVYTDAITPQKPIAGHDVHESQPFHSPEVPLPPEFPRLPFLQLYPPPNRIFVIAHPKLHANLKT